MLMTALTALTLLLPSSALAEEDETEDLSGFEWDVTFGPVLNTGIVMTGDTAGDPVFSAGVAGSASAGFKAGERSDEGKGVLTVLLGGTARTETPTGLIVGEASSRTYMGHLRIGGDFDWDFLDADEPDDDFDMFEFALLIGGGSKLSYDLDGNRLTDGGGNNVNQTVLIFGARGQANGPNRFVHIAPNLMFTFGGPESMDLPATAAFSLTTGITL